MEAASNSDQSAHEIPLPDVSPVWPPPPLQLVASEYAPLKFTFNRSYWRMLYNSTIVGVAFCMFFSLFTVANLAFVLHDALKGNSSGFTQNELPLCSGLVLLLIFSAVGAWLWQHLAFLIQVRAEDLPALQIDRAGVTEYASDHCVGLIPWHRIAAVTLSSRRGNDGRQYPGIVLSIRDRKGFCKNLPWWKSLLISIGSVFKTNVEQALTNKSLSTGGCTIWVSQSPLDVSALDAVEQIRHYRAQMTVAD